MPSFSFEIQGGQVVNKEWLWGSIKRLFQTLPDGRYTWKHPDKKKQSRSAQQNNYYWGVVLKILSDHTGYTQEEMHQILGKKFLSYEKNGEVFVKSTTKLKTHEFETYMEDCRRFAAMDLSCFIPLPNEPDNYYYDMLKFKKAS